jgi:hypothetical protein
LSWTLAIVLVILWLLLFSALKIAAWPVHLVLAAAVLAAAMAVVRQMQRRT